MPERRTLLLLIISAVPFSLAGISPMAVYLAVLANCTVIALYALDVHSLPAKADLSLQRELPAILSLDEATDVILRIRNEAGRTLRAHLQDNPPPSCQPSPVRIKLSVAPDSVSEQVYEMRPLKRGRFHFAPSVLRVRGPLGMAYRDYEFGPEDDSSAERQWNFTVYPRIGGTTPQRMAALARRLESGYHRLEREVEGTIPSQLSKWTAGDNYRDINWPATARYDYPMVTQFDTDRNQSIYIFVDCGRLMSMPVGRLCKLDYAVNACADLARVAVERGDRVGICGFSRDIKMWVDGRNKRQHLLGILRRLAELEADTFATNFSAPFNMFLSRSRRRSLCLFLTTFSEGTGVEQLTARLAGLRPRHVPAVVSLTDPEMEVDAHQSPETFDDACRKLAAADLREEIEVCAARLQQRQGYFLQAPADTLSPSAVQAYLDVKARGAL